MLQDQLLLVAGAPGLVREPGSLDEGVSCSQQGRSIVFSLWLCHFSSNGVAGHRLKSMLRPCCERLIVKVRFGLYPRDELVKRHRTFVALLARANSHRPRLGFLRAGDEHIRNLLEL